MNNDEMSAEEYLAQTFGCYTLIAACIMRQCGVSRDIATDITERIGEDLGRWFEEALEEIDSK